MRILLTGRTGQVGWELERALPALGDVIATDRKMLDLADPDAIRSVVREAKPNVIVNAAAYTAVDRAESEPDLAAKVNAHAPSVLAHEAKQLDALLVHFSTDYVFDGSRSQPYTELDEPKPLNVYGKTKLDGENAVTGSGCRHLVLRTSWVYGPRGHNFFLTVLQKLRAGEKLRIVDDQIGAPTSSHMIADATARAVLQVIENNSLGGIYHLSAGESASWCDFACAILQASGMRGEIEAISSSEYKSAARRPHYSLLDNSKIAHHLGIRLPSWRAGMTEVLAQTRQ